MIRMTSRIVVAVSLLSCAGALQAKNAQVAMDWKAKLPVVRSAVKHAFPRETGEAHYQASISKTADVTGTGQPIALVDLGSGGYTNDMTVMRMEGDEPVVAKFVSSDKTVAPRIFLSGISEGKGEAVEFRPEEHAVYSGHWVVNGAKLKRCWGEAYQWDASEKNFRFEKKLSKSMTREFCQRTATRIQPVILKGE